MDAAVTPYVEALAWKPFTDLVAARIIEADPAAAEARRVAESLARFVTTGQSDEFGLKTLIVKANAGDVIFFVAMCDRIAQCLAAEGDTDPVDVRRSKAVGILAQPALALALLQRHAAIAPASTTRRAARRTSRPARPAAAPTRARCPRRSRWTRTGYAPHATLYVRISEESLRSGTGVAVCGGTGAPARSAWSRSSRWRSCSGTAGSPSARSWTCATSSRSTPTRSPPGCGKPSSCPGPRACSRSATPTPNPTSTTPSPTCPPDRGGPPGQTRTDNLGPMTRFGHRVKTHGRGWRHHQPVPGVYLWRTPHGSWCRVDQHGTRPSIRVPPGRRPRAPPARIERAFARLILAA